jgi:Concanavalin A-like lectin/glucanases superfamily
MKRLATLWAGAFFLQILTSINSVAHAAPLLSNPTPIVEYNSSTITSGGMSDAAGLTNATFGNSPSVAGGVVTFNGVNQYAVTSTSLAPTFSALGTSYERSLSAFVYIYPTGQNGVILDELGTTAINDNWHDTQIEMVSGTLYFRVWDCSFITSNRAVAQNSWSHVGFTYDYLSRTMTAYVNGLQAGQITNCSRQVPWRESNVGLYYGFASTSGTNAGSGAYGNFKLGQFDLYTSALTGSQVSAANNSVRSNFNPLSTPAAPTILSRTADTVSISDTAVANASSYIAYLYASNGTTFVDSRTVTTAAISTGTTFTGLTPNTTYVAKVQAIGDQATYGNSSISSGTSFTTLTGSTTLSLALDSGLTTVTYRQIARIKATPSVPGMVTFFYRGKRIAGCVRILSSGGFAYCNWLPSGHGQFTVTASFAPTNNNYLSSVATSPLLTISTRSGNR